MQRLVTALVTVASAVSVGAAQLSLADVVERLMTYTGNYSDKLSTVIASETYDQRVEEPGIYPATPQAKVSTKTVKSEYALTRVTGGWIGYRDAYEVDGVKLPDRVGRLERVLANASGSEMNAILDENARFNVYSNRISRNINIPTLVLQLLSPQYRDRFVFEKAGEEALAGRRVWKLDYKERARPTIVRRNDNEDQPVHGTVWIDPMSGNVWRTNLMWEKGPAGNIQVDYGHAPGVDVLVPLKMVEKYRDGTTEVRSTATYSNFRQFRTGGRLISPP